MALRPGLCHRKKEHIKVLSLTSDVLMALVVKVTAYLCYLNDL